MNIEKNISELRKSDPALADVLSVAGHRPYLKIIESRNGNPSIIINNITLHSRYDPVKEAKEWVQHYREKIEGSKAISVFGFGLGYHILELCKDVDKEITVFEPKPEVLRAALESVDLTSILSKVKIITDINALPVEHNSEILVHKPSYELNRKYFDSLQDKIRNLANINRSLKILVVGPVYGGSLPIAEYCSSALKKLGHNVEFVDYGRFSDVLFYTREITSERTKYNSLINKFSSFLSEAFLLKCEEFKPDLVFVLAQAPLNEECLVTLKRNKIPTAFWFVEDFRFMEYWKNIAGYYDYFFTIQKGAFFEELEKSGVRNYHYLPMAASPDIHKPCKPSEEERDHYGSDISFMGAGYYNRRQFLKGLMDFDFKIWGTDWNIKSELGRHIQRSGERINTDEVVRIFNAAKININLHSSTYHAGINPFGDFVNPRTFEIISCGGFQVVDKRSGLEGLFDINKEIVVYEDLDDLKRKIKYYLNNPEEREVIAEKGRQRILRDHTYEHRMKEMLEYIAGKGYKPPVWTDGGENVDKLIEEADAETELGKYLSQFINRGKVGLDDITETIKNGEGDLSRTESMFLLMDKFIHQ